MKVRPLTRCLVGLWWTCCAVTASAVPPYVKSGSIPKLSLDATGSLGNATNTDSQRFGRFSRVANKQAAPAAEQNLTDAWWPLWWGGAKDRKKNTTVASTEADTKKKKERKMETSKKRGKEKSASSTTSTSTNKKKGKKSNTTATAVEEDPQKHKKQEEKKAEDKPASQNTTATETESQTTTATSSPNQTQQTQKQPPHIIVMGQPPPGMQLSGPPNLYRPPMTPQQQQMRNAATSLAAFEALAGLLNFARLGLILWVTRYLANRIETFPPTQHFVFERLNDRFLRDTIALNAALAEPPVGISLHRWNRVMNRRRRQPNISDSFQRPSLQDVFKKTVIVVEYGNNDLDVQYLADLISFLIAQHQEHAFGSVPYQLEGEDPKTGKKKTVTYFKPVTLEVVFNINSPGGSVATFGLAAAQVNRLRQSEGITTTMCVDKYAASGGYMIASQANNYSPLPLPPLAA
jgi:hypothetical protein